MSTDVLSLIKAADVSGFIADIGRMKTVDDFQPLITAAMISGSTDCLQDMLSAGKSLGNISFKIRCKYVVLPICRHSQTLSVYLCEQLSLP